MKKILLISILLFFITGCSLTNQIVVNGNSMMPTLKNGDIISYKKTNKLNRFDIIYFTNENSKLIKRIYGLPGENIIIDNGSIYINGEKIYSDSFDLDNISGDTHITLKDNEYFVLGDNLKVSRDSRHIGPIKKENIKGVIRI